jgi:hypothetical protein
MVVARQADKTYKSPSLQSRFGLNAANFFQAEAVGVVLPVLNTFLREAHSLFPLCAIAALTSFCWQSIFSSTIARSTDSE